MKSSYKSKIMAAVEALDNVFVIPTGGAQEFLLQNRCRADFCFDIRPKGRLFIEDDDGARGVNNLIKYWIWSENNPSMRPLHVIHIVETSRPAQIDNIRFLATKMQQAIPSFACHIITLANWQSDADSWVSDLRDVLTTIAGQKN